MLGVLQRAVTDRQFIEELKNDNGYDNNNNEDDNIDDAESVVSEMFPQMDAAKSMREILDLKGFL